MKNNDNKHEFDLLAASLAFFGAVAVMVVLVLFGVLAFALSKALVGAYWPLLLSGIAAGVGFLTHRIYRSVDR